MNESSKPVLSYARPGMRFGPRWLVRGIIVLVLLGVSFLAIRQRVLSEHERQRKVIASSWTTRVQTDSPVHRLMPQRWRKYFDRVRYVELHTAPGRALAALLGELDSVHELKATYCMLTDEDRAWLGGMKGLRILRLEGTPIGDASADAIASLSRLELLDVRDTMLTDKSAEAIARIKTLRELRIAGTTMTDHSVKRIREALPECVIDRVGQ